MEVGGGPPTAGRGGNWFKDFFKLGEVGGYFFRRKDPNRPRNVNIRAMHIINKIAILMFLICILIILKRYFFGH
jgi:hypothetical protein